MTPSARSRSVGALACRVLVPTRMRPRLRRIATALLLAMATPAGATEMVEIPTPPDLLQRRAEERAHEPTVPAPDATQPVPPPIVATPPSLPPTHWRVRPRLDLIAIGGGVFAGSYGATLIAGLAGPRLWRLDVPVAGPLWQIPRVGYGAGPMPAFMLALDAVGQASGLVILVVGLASRRLRLERVHR